MCGFALLGQLLGWMLVYKIILSTISKGMNLILIQSGHKLDNVFLSIYCDLNFTFEPICLGIEGPIGYYLVFK